jgi:hypothetical protein
VRVFSATLLVEQGWRQLISLCPSEHPRVNPFIRSEDESVSRVLCVRVLVPTEGLGGAALVGGVLQMVLESTLAVARTGQCADIGCMARVGLRWDTLHGIWVGTGRTVAH